MERFVVVNNRILDFDKYKNDFLLLQRIIAADLMEYFLKLGFKTTAAKTNKGCFRRQIAFYNEEMDFTITLAISKKGKPVFV